MTNASYDLGQAFWRKRFKPYACTRCTGSGGRVGRGVPGLPEGSRRGPPAGGPLALMKRGPLLACQRAADLRHDARAELLMHVTNGRTLANGAVGIRDLRARRLGGHNTSSLAARLLLRRPARHERIDDIRLVAVEAVGNAIPDGRPALSVSGRETCRRAESHRQYCDGSNSCLAHLAPILRAPRGRALSPPTLLASVRRR